MTEHSPRTGLLLVNLGTPGAPTVAAVRRYLREFLADPRVIDLPRLQRSLLLNLVILPFRPRRSAAAYAKIFDPERGSPLLFHSRDLTKKVGERLAAAKVQVDLAMRYGEPSIDAALDRFAEAHVERVVVFPLYPQYAVSTTASTIEAVTRAVSQRWIVPSLAFVPPFFDHPAFIEAFAARARPILADSAPERILFSFHGLPERHLKKGDPTGARCLVQANCCETLGPENALCYRAQCVATMRLLGDALAIDPAQRVLGFQSRLGRIPWIQPYTDEVLDALLADGVKKIAVLTPAFVADGLETLEEIGIEARKRWLDGGGERFDLIPCPNASDTFADAIVRIARDHSAWLNRT
ncbi:MAG: ferrochelatase [Deltaproteobacteria bacterium]|nr:ferrochelatase [Deltaproteobacteria bacterium]